MKQLLYGPWGEAYRGRLIDTFLPFLRANQVDNCFYVVPTAGLAADIRQRLLAHVPGWMGKPVMTFDDLITRILQASPIPCQRIDAVMQERSIHHIMQQSQRLWTGKPLSEWAHYPGIVRTLLQTIAELRRSGVFVGDFQTVADEDLRTLADVWQQYEYWQRQNTQTRLLDVEEGFLYAEELLNQYGIEKILPNLQCVVFDHFLDFSPLQKRILSHFRNVDTCLLYVPFAPSKEGYPELKQSIGKLEQLLVHADQQPFAVLRLDDMSQTALPDMHMRLTPVKSVEKQWLWIAKEIKKRVNSGASLDQIAILVPDLQNHMSVLHKILEIESIPHRALVKQPLLTIPLAQDMLTVLRIAARNWQRDDVLTHAVRSNLQGERISVHMLQQLSYKLGIQQGYETWVTRLETYEQSLEEGNKEKANVANILQWLKKASMWVEQLPAKAPVDVYVQNLLAYIQTLHVRERLIRQAKPLVQKYVAGRAEGLKEPAFDMYSDRLCSGTSSIINLRANMRAMDAIFLWAEQVLKIEQQLQRDEDKVSIQEFFMLVETDWEGIEIEVTDAKDAGVWILEPTAARGMAFDHVFLANLNEGVFPKAERAQWLLREEQRQQLVKHGVELPLKQLQLDLQKAFFDMSLYLAKQQLDFVYVDGGGMLRSRFLEALLREHPGWAEQCSQHIQACSDSYLQGSSLLPSDWRDISNRKERDLWLFAYLPLTALQTVLTVESEPESESESEPESVSEQVETRHFKQILHAIAMEAGRANGELDQYGGKLLQQEIIEELQSAFHFDRAYSASFFNQYGSCPFQFFLNRVIQVELPEEDGDILAPADRGNLYHKVLFRLYREWKERQDRKLSEADRTKWLEALQTILSEEIAELEQTTYIAGRLTWQIEKENIQKTLQQWVERDLQLFGQMEANMQPYLLEWSFGLPLDDTEQCDPHSTEQPLEIAGLKFSGRIDRVDYAQPQGVYMVYDYKTTGNSLTGKKDLEKGIDFQLALYLHAVERNKQLLGMDDAALAAGALYYGIEKQNRSKGLYHETYKGKIGLEQCRSPIQADAWETTLDQAIETVVSYHQSIRSGDFSLLPRNCTAYCPYKTVCRFDPIQQIQRDLKQENQVLASSQGVGNHDE